MSGSPAVGRFAPSTTGRAHPGTLLAALLCWLDARSRGAQVVLRLEDLDPERCKPTYAAAMQEDLAWLGLDWDDVVVQSHRQASHESALDKLAEAGVLYPCRCSRADLRGLGRSTPDGGFRYPGTCRARSLPAAGWRASRETLRLRLGEGELGLCDESGLDLSQDPAGAFGDPVVRRRDGAIAYHLASVVDDASAGVTRIVRGRDLAATTATQVRIRLQLGLPVPDYRHHFLLMEERGGKLAKFHGAVDTSALRPAMSAAELVGFLAFSAGLRPTSATASPAELLLTFAWEHVRTSDQTVAWTPPSLSFGGAAKPISE